MLFCRDDRSTVKIIDFGFAARLTCSDKQLFTQCGTPGYLSPEILKERIKTFVQIDIYFIGFSQKI